MVGNRPVVGVRNPVCFSSSSIYLRAKNAAALFPERKINHFPPTHISSLPQEVSPVRLLEAASQS